MFGPAVAGVCAVLREAFDHLRTLQPRRLPLRLSPSSIRPRHCCSVPNRRFPMGERGPRPVDELPQPLVDLLDARGQAAQDAAWSAFVETYSSLILQVARSSTNGHDAAMDAYAFALEQLRDRDCSRLRAFRST